MRREIHHAARRQLSTQKLKVWVYPKIDIGPIIQTGSFEISIGKAKPQGFHKVKGSMRCGTRPCNIPGVLGDFRLVENHMNRRPPTASALDQFYLIAAAHR